MLVLQILAIEKECSDSWNISIIVRDSSLKKSNKIKSHLQYSLLLNSHVADHVDYTPDSELGIKINGMSITLKTCHIYKL